MKRPRTDGGVVEEREGPLAKRGERDEAAEAPRLTRHEVLTAATPTVLFRPGPALGPGARARLAVQPEGLLLVRGFCSPAEAEAISATLDSPEAERLSWTGLKPGGGSVKCYTGTEEGLGMLGNKYKRVWGRARRTALLPGAELARARERAALLAPPEARLLTEQLIKYAPDDSFFNLHWDIDSETPEAPLPSGSGSELGPGCVIAALNLRCPATLLLQPRYPPSGPSARRALHLAPGDLYLLAGPARWCWLHGLSVHPDTARQGRRAVVWRFKRVV